MGLITPSQPSQVEKESPRGAVVRFPWLPKDHPLQKDEVYHASLGFGFCGCLTSFASWNTQMVVMLDGTYCELGSQVVAVFFGYAIGLMGAMASFRFGKRCGLWLYNFRNRNSTDETEGTDETEETETDKTDETDDADERNETDETVDRTDETEERKGETDG